MNKKESALIEKDPITDENDRAMDVEHRAMEEKDPSIAEFRSAAAGW